MNANRELEPRLDGKGLRIGIVMSHCNSNTCENLLAACMSSLAKLGVQSDDISLSHVPGVLEIPLMLQAMARTGHFDALVALGSVVRGEKSYRFEVICHTCATGIAQVQMDTGIPVANGVMMTETEQPYGLPQNGERAAATAVAMANLMHPFRSSSPLAAAAGTP